MRTLDENFLNMGHSTLDTMNNNKPSWEGIPRIVTQVGYLNTGLKAADTFSVESTTDTTGTTQDRKNARAEVILLTVKLAKPASVYALDNNDMDMNQQLSISKGSLSRLPHRYLLSTVKAIYGILSLIAEKIVDMGVKPEDIEALKTAVDTYEIVLNKPRDKKVEKKTVNEQLDDAVSDLRGILYVLDSLMKYFDGTQFYSEYKNARIILDLGIRHRNKE